MEKTEKLVISVTPEQKQYIEGKAKEADLRTATFIRTKIISALKA